MTWPTRALTEPVTVLTPPRADDTYGPGAADWANADSFDTTARLQPAATSEGLVNVDEQQADMQCYLPPGTPITGRDRLVAAGDTYEVIGPPSRWRSPWNSTEHHVRALLRRIERAGLDSSGERDADPLVTQPIGQVP